VHCHRNPEPLNAFVLVVRIAATLTFGLIAIVEGEFAACVVVVAAPTPS